MADLKISALPASTTPLAGTEVLPIVQSSATKQVSVANLTAGRTQTSNGIVQGTAATGYNFTANTPVAGMTSQLLNWYEEGTWTPADASGAGLTLTVNQATYTRIGRQVTAQLYVTYPANVNVTGAAITLPFTPAAGLTQATAVLYTNGSVTMAAVNTGTTYMSLYAGLVPVANGSLAGKFIIYTIVYFV